jgi:hypothetical protein
MGEGVCELDDEAEGEDIMGPSTDPRISSFMASEPSPPSPAWVHGRRKSFHLWRCCAMAGIR